MIRDPSDGSVREPTKSEVGIPATNMPVPDPGIDTGLAPIEKDRAVRLQRSREWLKTYLETMKCKG